MSENTIIIKDGIKTLVDIREYITDVVIPNSVTYIGWSTFSNCTSLTKISIPNSVTEIGWKAFKCCLSLKAIYIDKEKDSLNLRCAEIPENCKVYWRGEF